MIRLGQNEGEAMITHKLKIEENYLENLKDGRKRVEIRYNDRDYQLGDTLEFCDGKGVYSFMITHVHSGLGMAEGFVALSLVKL